MGSELAVIQPSNIDEAERLSTILGKATLIPDALRGKPSDILATILAGAELGLAPMQSIRGIAIVKGKPTLSADTMGALCKRRSDICEYLTLVSSSATVATYEAKRKGEPKPTTLSFSMEDATRAGLSGSDTYRKFPNAMLRARALSAICRAVFPDLCLGLYDPDELADHPAPPPQRIEVESKSDAAEAKFKAKMVPVATDVAFTPSATPPPAPVVEAPPTPWDNVLALCKRDGVHWKKAAAWLKEQRNVASTKAVTQADALAYEGHLAVEKTIPTPAVKERKHAHMIVDVPSEEPKPADLHF